MANRDEQACWRYVSESRDEVTDHCLRYGWEVGKHEDMRLKELPAAVIPQAAKEAVELMDRLTMKYLGVLTLDTPMLPAEAVSYRIYWCER